MEFAVLRDILTTEVDGKADGDSIKLGEGVTLLVDSGGHNPMTVARVQSVRHAGHYLEIVSAESRLFIGETSVVSVKVDRQEKERAGRAGFH